MSTSPERREDHGERADHDITRDSGLQPETAPGLQFASSLRGNRVLHRLIAIIGLLVIAAILINGVVEFIQSSP